LEEALQKVDSYKPVTDMLKGKWSDLKWPASPEAKHSPRTGVPQGTLVDVAKASVELPTGFVSSMSSLNSLQNIHPRLERHVKARLKSLDSGKVDFATAEAMAFGSLMLEGHDVRISGQDVGRGTFSQR
jgi:probable 2-oxoglutarate dehydrogenase E1 component DHKTD1